MRKVRYKNTPFLVEVVVNILVFSIACAILVSAFVQASLMVRHTQEESLAGSELYALTETMKVYGEAGLESAQPQPDGKLRLYYNQNWQPASTADAYYVDIEVVKQPRATGNMYYLSLWAYRQNGEEITSLSTIVYIPQKVVAGI